MQDRRIIIGSLLTPLLVWILVVAMFTVLGFPGTVCATPVAWLLAGFVGRNVILSSPAPGNAPYRQAAIAGGLLGLIGLLFFLIESLLVSQVLPVDLPYLALFGLGSGLGGIVLCSGIAAGTAYLFRGRRPVG